MSDVSGEFEEKYGKGIVERIFFNIIGDRKDADICIMFDECCGQLDNHGVGFYYPDGDEKYREVRFDWSDGIGSGSAMYQFKESGNRPNIFVRTYRKAVNILKWLRFKE